MRILLTATLSLLLCFAAFATEPPHLAQPLPLPNYNSIAPQVPVQLHTRPATWLKSLDDLKGWPLSGTVYHQALKHFQPTLAVGQLASGDAVQGRASSIVERRSQRRISATALPSFLEHLNPATNTTNNSNSDVEPTTMATTSPLGTVYTNLFWTEYGGPYGQPYDYYQWSTDGVNFTAPTQFPLPTGFTDPFAFTGDPSATAALGDGSATPRLYFAQAGYHTTDPGSSGQSGIFVFASASGGQSWAGPVQAANSNDGNLMLDQPNITVSWSTTPPPGYASTNGFVYTAYNLFHLPDVNRSDGNIFIRRSRAGIMCIGRCRAVCPCTPSFDDQVLVVHGNVATPQVVVDNAGAVHVFYLNYGNVSNGRYAVEERVAPPVVDPSTQNIAFTIGPRVIGWETEMPNYQVANGTVRGINNLRARHSPQTDRIEVTWTSALNVSGAWFSQVYLNSGDANGNWSYTQGQILDYNPFRDQFQPGLDFDAAGNLLVTWFDTRFSPSNTQWRQVVRYITPTGALVNAGIGTTDIAHFDSQAPTNGFIGDYHEVWRWNGVWNDPWIGWPTTGTLSSDLYFSWVK